MITDKQKEEIKLICRQRPTEEICGVICENGYVIPIKNIHNNPTSQFKLCPKEQATAEILNGKIIAIFHSHINGKGPSFNDKYSSSIHNIDFITYDLIHNKFHFTNPVGYDHFLNKDFEIGVSDCYTLVQDYYREELKINLGKYTRFENWFHIDPYFFDKNIEKEGFKIVHTGPLDENSDLQTNDAILFNMIPDHDGCNHVAIYLGNGRMLHHQRGKKSQIHPLSLPYLKRTKYVVRHENVIKKNKKRDKTKCVKKEG